MKIFYIHGYGSSPDSDTRALFEKLFNQEVVGLTYDHNLPVESIGNLAKLLRKETDRCVVIGSSLGGFIANELSGLVPGNLTVLYNPSLTPSLSLRKYDDVTCEALYRYKFIEQNGFESEKPCSKLVILSTDDNVVPHREARDRFENKANVIFTTGGHRMTLENAKIIVERVNFAAQQLEGETNS